jgi:hypothetical protein
MADLTNDLTRDLSAFAEPMARLFQQEKLDRIDRLVATPSWDKYPACSRLQRIEFLDHLPLRERSYVLFAFMLPLLDRVMRRACELKRGNLADFVAYLSIGDWHDEDEDPLPPIPEIYVCSKVETLVDRKVNILGLHSKEALLVSQWIERLGQSDQWDIAQSPKGPGADPDLFCVYVGHRKPVCAGMTLLAQTALGKPPKK